MGGPDLPSVPGSFHQPVGAWHTSLECRWGALGKRFTRMAARFPSSILHDIAPASAECYPALSRRYQKEVRYACASCPAASPEALDSPRTAALAVAPVFSGAAQTVSSRRSSFLDRLLALLRTDDFAFPVPPTRFPVWIYRPLSGFGAPPMFCSMTFNRASNSSVSSARR